MKQAAATLDKTSRNPQPAVGLGTAKGNGDLRTRPMVRAAGTAAGDERMRPRRLRAADAPLPPVSRLVYRAGAVVTR